MATTKGIYTTNRTYVALLRGTYAYVETYITDPFFSYNSLLLSGDTTAIPFNADASTNKFNITVFGDTKATNFSPYTSGYYSAYFDGSGDYLSVPSNTAFAFGTGDFTVECFFNLSIPQSTRSMHLTDSTETNGLFLKLTSGNVSIGRTGTAEDSVFSYSFLINTWYHVAFSRSGTTVYCFVNGSLVGSTTNSINYAQGGYTIGTAGGAAQPFEGYISNLRMLKGTALYTAAFTPITTPLTAIANTSLLTCQENRFIDDSPNNFTITKNGDVSIKPSNPFLPSSSVTVNNLYSTNFDGTGDYLTVPYNSALNLGSATTWTMEYWVYFNAVSGTYTPISFVQTGDIRWGIEHAASTTLLLFNNSTAVTFTNPTTLTPNIWYHIAWVRDGTNVRLYINGVVSSTTSTNNLQSISSGPLNIGYNAVGGYEFYMNGSISNLRVVKGTALYTGTFTPPTAPLTAITNTSLLTCQSATLVDNSTNNFAITSAGQAQPIPVSPFTQTTTAVNTTYLGSGYLDGAGDYLSIPANAAFTFGTNDHTIEFYYYLPSTSLAGGYATQWKYSSASTQQATNDYYFQIGTAGGSNVGLLLGGGGSWGVLIQPSVSINTFVGVWTHIAWTRSGNTFRLFFNGVQVGTGTYAGSISAQSNPMLLGQDGAGSYAGGYYSNFRVNNGTALYTANFAPPLTPLTAVTNTSLLTLQNSQPHNNNTFLDNSSNKFLITRNGNTTQGTFSPYGGNWSIYAPATGSYVSGSNSIFNISSTTVVWTYESWVMPLTNTIFFAIGSGGSYGNSIYIGWATNKFNVGGGNGAGSNPVTFETTNTYPAGAWYHVAVTRTSAGVYTLYINGVADGTQTYNAGALAGGTTFVINGVNDNNGLGNSGGSFYVSNMRFLVGTALYTGNFTVPTAPLTAIANTAVLTGQDNRFIDDSLNNLTLTTAGSVSVQRFSPFSPLITTLTTYSASFDGTGDYLTVPSTDVFAFGTGAYTIEAWVYVTSRSLEASIWATGANNNNFLITTGGLLRLYNGTSYTGTTVIPLNTWAHVAVVRTSTASNGTQLFVNGVSDLVFTDTTNQTSATTGVIGVNGTGGEQYFFGSISNLRVVKGTAVYTSNFTPPTTPLTAIAGTSLLTCQSPSLIDNSTNAFAITVVGGARPTTLNPFGFTNTASIYSPSTFGGSGYFDGVNGSYLTIPANASCTLGTNNHTIECWYYAAGAQQSSTVLWAYAAGSTNQATNSYYLSIGNGSGNLLLGNGGGWGINIGFTSPSLNAWHHMAVVRSGNVFTLYIDGVPAGSGTYAATIASQSSFPFIIGGQVTGSGTLGSTAVLGYVTDVRFNNGTALYTSNFVPPLAPVTAVANTSLLLNFTDAAVTDSSMMVNLESLGDAKITTANSRVGGSAMFFDGTGDYLQFATNAALAFGTRDFTAECWVNFSTNNGTYNPFVRVDGSGTFDFGYDFSTAQLKHSGAAAIFAVSQTFTAGIWYHVALTRASGSCRLFVNGIQVGTTVTGNTDNYGSSAFKVGGSSYSGAHVMAGYIDDLRITKYARYTSNFTPINSSHPLR